MRFILSTGFAALALGAVLASAPARAANSIPGYSSSGGVVAIPNRSRHHMAHSKTLYNKAPNANRNEPKGGRTAD